MIFALLDAIVVWIAAGRLLYEFFKTGELVYIIPCAIFSGSGCLFTKMFWVDLELMIEKRRDTKDIAERQEEETAQEQQNETAATARRKPRGR